MNTLLRRIVLGILVKGLLFSIPVVAAPIVERWHPPITQPPIYLDSIFSNLSDVQRYRLTLYFEILGRNLTPDDFFKLKNILDCESGMRQYAENGDVLISPTSDVGIGQINHVNFDEAINLGYDIYDPYDNIRYTVWKYSVEGERPWVCSTIVE